MSHFCTARERQFTLLPISKYWKQLLLQCNYDDMNLNCIKESLQNHNSLLRFLDMKNSEMRDIIGENTSSSICGKMFWMRKYNFDISNHYIISYNSTKESRLRLLHFKILHNIFPSNILLNRMGIKDSERCDYCGEIDVIEHMFVHCTRLKGFWSMVFNEIFSRTNLRIESTDQNILFGISKTDPPTISNNLKIINHIILIAKMCISKTKFGAVSNLFITFDLELTVTELLNSQPLILPLLKLLCAPYHQYNV